MYGAGGGGSRLRQKRTRRRSTVTPAQNRGRVCNVAGEWPTPATAASPLPHPVLSHSAQPSRWGCTRQLRKENPPQWHDAARQSSLRRAGPGPGAQGSVFKKHFLIRELL